MQLITDGPDIPDTLIEAHEEGRVVFFCGAGISRPTLPDFGGLVKDLYRHCGTRPSRQEQELIDAEQYDAALDQLEERLPGQNAFLRPKLYDALQFKPKAGIYKTHRALLELGRDPKGRMRLVTTNYDRMFIRAAMGAKLKAGEYPAPQLPVPKQSHWDGVAYLHGLLPDSPAPAALNRLVLTSGDFGLAYLVERWAARFVSELLRNYIVCFVGYRIGDPILRYMMDAIAADRRQGNQTQKAYAFGECKPGEETEQEDEWRKKGVQPILYEKPPGDQSHSKLHGTLRAWAETYRTGIAGREAIVTRYAVTRPMPSTRQDDYVGRVLWAISHRSGEPARRFAEHTPVPPLEWLYDFAAPKFQLEDLPRYGVAIAAGSTLQDTFSLTLRPSPFDHAPWMRLVSHGVDRVRHDKVMVQLSRWLARHLGDPELLLWLVKNGAQLHTDFAWQIEHQLDKVAALEMPDKLDELQRTRKEAPNAIPSPSLRTLWRLLLSGAIKSPRSSSDLYLWKRRLSRDGPSIALRQELRTLLTPKATLPTQYRYGTEARPEGLTDLTKWKVEVSSSHAQHTLREMRTSAYWQTLLPGLLYDAEQLLSDALALRGELNPDTLDHDSSYWRLPSISPHEQNREREREDNDWVVLIQLLRDAWLAVLEQNPERARTATYGWRSQPHPIFHRLALFAASQEQIAPNGKWVDWLLDCDHRWLWADNCRREVMRLLVLQGANLPPEQQGKLEHAILAGPAWNVQQDEGDEEHQQLVERAIWLRLTKLHASGCTLGSDAREELSALQLSHEQWQLASDESDEFMIWSYGTDSGDWGGHQDAKSAPRTMPELAGWLREQHTGDNDWQEICGTQLDLCSDALRSLASEGIWPARYWREALQAWSDKQFATASWESLAELLQAMPENLLVDIAHSLTWWLRSIAGHIGNQDEELLPLCERLLEVAAQLEDGVATEEPVTRAINHPSGHVTQALLDYLFASKPGDNQGLLDALRQLFTALCDLGRPDFRHARLLLSAHQIALFRIDREWAENFLLPLLDWQRDATEAAGLWQAYLWSARLYRPLLGAYKRSFLETARHYQALGDYARQYASVLTIAALDPADTFTSDEMREAIAALPDEGLCRAADTLTQALQGAGERQPAYWREKIVPFWQALWPKEQARITTGLAEELAELAITAGEQFPAAMAMLQEWLMPFRHSDRVVMHLQESGLCGRFPEEALQLLARITDQTDRAPLELGGCLTAIAGAAPKSVENLQFQALRTFARQHGMNVNTEPNAEEEIPA
ncbi:anti-phage defense-associated sirtuin Dsr1 [Microbulbifer mangrovi]|uniref:anti-phage defense-associated sirtuin Dsr1 n=1 Tax=Microbulbifer mangrovi TaxID=927787 RepID=UPI00099084FA|nr:anti-phage defense-associated sirtuin Dsr1 [Microbulbifer mangrovi]